MTKQEWEQKVKEEWIEKYKNEYKNKNISVSISEYFPPLEIHKNSNLCFSSFSREIEKVDKIILITQRRFYKDRGEVVERIMMDEKQWKELVEIIGL